MSVKDKTEPIVIAEIVELFCGDNILSNVVVSKNEVHNSNSIKNTFCFDCSTANAALFEKAIVSSLTVNNIISASIIDVSVKLNGYKYITVEFITAQN